MTALSFSALDLIWMEMTPLFHIKGNPWSDGKWMRNCGSVNNLDGFYLHLLAASSPTFTPQHTLSDSHPRSDIQKVWEQHFFISGNCLESKEHKTIIINWLKKPSTNTKNKSEHTHWLILHENEWEQITLTVMNNEFKKQNIARIECHKNLTWN